MGFVSLRLEKRRKEEKKKNKKQYTKFARGYIACLWAWLLTDCVLLDASFHGVRDLRRQAAESGVQAHLAGCIAIGQVAAEEWQASLGVGNRVGRRIQRLGDEIELPGDGSIRGIAGRRGRCIMKNSKSLVWRRWWEKGHGQ